MALAHLTRTLPSVENGDSELHGFIVDHQVRDGSGEEAEAVAEALNALKITPHVMKMDWGGQTPVRAMETLARVKRYELMAKKSVELKIGRVLLGHHEDDRVETILFRILSASRGEGLATMRAEARMPERYAVYGADELRIGRPLGTVPKVRIILPTARPDADYPEPTHLHLRSKRHQMVRRPDQQRRPSHPS